MQCHRNILKKGNKITLYLVSNPSFCPSNVKIFSFSLFGANKILNYPIKIYSDRLLNS